jgi:isochorismate synthase
VAPFSISDACPLVLIRPDVVQSFASYRECTLGADDFSLTGKRPLADRETSYPNRETYADDFHRFFAGLSDGRFSKLVLSRCAELETGVDEQPLTLFQRACEMYPRMFISLVFTPQSGMWLTATPEILLEGIDNQWRTIALAGTMKLEGDDLLGEGENMTWSTKNIQEQRYVATYITRQLEQFTHDFTEEGPRTARAGHLAHLRSDFLFSLPDESVVGDLLQALHPTPAVCGLPKQEAFRFIRQNEHHDRSYYSGFLGPLFLHRQTHLFVTLRCMQLFRDGYRLYAGGGLLKDSVEEQEWQETETKLDTIRCLFHHHVQ